MIEIRTNGGVSLDLAPDTEFEVEMNNPFLESDLIPVAFSTAITFPPSETNRSEFGYLPAMLLPPSVTRLGGVTILSAGIPILKGTLVYDSVDEDGNLVYSFTERTVDSELDGKLWNLDLPRYSPSGSQQWATADALAADVRAGRVSGIGAPVLYDPEGSVTKFHNLPVSGDTRFTPCVTLRRLFDEAGDIQFDEYLSGLLTRISILGLYKPFTGEIKGYGDTLSIADALPDVTLLELLKLFCKMSCSALFADGGGYLVMPFEMIVIQEPVDWDGKISDGHTFALEKGEGYGFGYQKEDSGNEGTSSEALLTVATLKGVLDARRNGTYVPVTCSLTGDSYSVPPTDGDLGDHDYFLAAEMLNMADEEYDTDVDGEKMDNTLSAYLIRNVPIYFELNEWDEDDSYPEGGIWITTESCYKMAGLVSFPADGGERDSKVILGAYGSGQLVSKGYGMMVTGEDYQIGSDLSARALLRDYHQSFIDWIAKDRQVISLDVNLSRQDIAAFRMWQVVTVRNRLFLVKRLTIRLSVRKDSLLCSAELVSL